MDAKGIALAGALAVGVLLLLGCVSTGMVQNSGAGNAQTGENAAGDGKTLMEQREGYGVPMEIFDALPEAPGDFNKLVSLMRSGKFRNCAFFSEKYFLQPEFYPSFSEHGLPYWASPDSGRYGVVGFGFFPGQQQVEIGRGESATARFFVHAAFGVQTYQGMKIEAVKPENSGFLEIEVFEPEFFLSPSYPEFTESWSHAVDVRISVGGDAQPGIYAIKFIATQPSGEKIAEWEREIDGRYVNAASGGADVYGMINVRVE